MASRLMNAIRKLVADKSATITTVISLSIIPISIGTGVAIDLGRTMNVKGKLQAAMDAAVISGVTVSTDTRNTYASSVFTSQGQFSDITATTPQFVTNADQSFTGTITATVPMSILSLVGKSNITLNIRSKVSAPIYDDSCILSFGKGLSMSTDALTLNGSSNTNLTGCKLRSNRSMSCNGHTGGADATYASGSVDNKCLNPYSNQTEVRDIHAALASNITPQCGLTSNSLTWPIGSPPSSPNMITIVKGTVTEYHICGSVTLSGAGTFLGNASSDSILVIENGDLTIAKDANVTLTRTTIVFTGSTGSHKLQFPNGAGQSATLRISPSIDTANPWRGVGIYQDPALTSNIDITWGPGANLYADGLLYFANASVTISGNAFSNGSECTKLVTNTFTSNGSVDLKQSLGNCAYIGLKQYRLAPYLLM
ncbi:MAG: Tad domain-containing protein [Hyphomicrobiales bacterium]|nr:Tad domain-containing protein [Hyphomicrobiales bacterium]